uniref:Uncharacterized protein n=1 Tax=Arundo donax TaxID=35708 RepID=A0A0A9D4A7_ARUDO
MFDVIRYDQEGRISKHLTKSESTSNCPETFLLFQRTDLCQNPQWSLQVDIQDNKGLFG